LSFAQIPTSGSRSNPPGHTPSAVAGSKPPDNRTFRPDIEGLRAIAVVLVLLNHAGLALFSGGYVGVDVFFVLSGFLITGLLLREIETTGRVSLVNFYARRARRLLPASALVLAVTVLASYRFIGGNRADRIAEDARWSALFASNFRFIEQGTDYLDARLPPSPLQHFWSLAVEEQFYFVWPALMMLVAVLGSRSTLRTRLSFVLTGIILSSLAWSYHQTAVDGTTAYFSPFTRASELAAGALLAVGLRSVHRLPARIGPWLSWAGIAGIIGASLLYSNATPFPGVAILLPVTASMLVIVGGTIAPNRGAETLLRRRPFQLTGKISYSLYLWHWPLLVIGAAWAGRDLSVPENLGLCLVAVALSAITYLIVEDPVRNSTRLRSAPAFASVAVGAALVVLSFGFFGWMLSSQGGGERTVSGSTAIEIPSTLVVLQAVADGAQVTSWPQQPPRIRNQAYSKECDVTRKDTTSNLCVHGDPNGDRTVVVYGDSHANMWIPALDIIGRQEHIRIIQIAKPGCPPADFPIYSGTLKREYTECAAYRDWAIQQIRTIQPDMIIISGAFKDVKAWVDGEPNGDEVERLWQEGLASTLDQLVPLAQDVIVLGDMAYPAEPGIDCLTAHADNVTACNTIRSDAVFAEHNRLEETTAEAHGARYIDIIPWFCTDSTCPAVVGGLTTHRDAYHVAENYVVWLAGALGEATGLVPSGSRLSPVSVE
jgi:peptidoglycan/LPS O-acetylase OafA/YrhL